MSVRAVAAFEVPGIVAEPGTPEQLAASSGEWLVAGGDGDTLTFSHFDGRTLRVYQLEIGEWQVHASSRNS